MNQKKTKQISKKKKKKNKKLKLSKKKTNKLSESDTNSELVPIYAEINWELDPVNFFRKIKNIKWKDIDFGPELISNLEEYYSFNTKHNRKCINDFILLFIEYLIGGINESNGNSFSNWGIQNGKSFNPHVDTKVLDGFKKIFKYYFIWYYPQLCQQKLKKFGNSKKYKKYNPSTFHFRKISNKIIINDNTPKSKLWEFIVSKYNARIEKKEKESESYSDEEEDWDLSDGKKEILQSETKYQSKSSSIIDKRELPIKYQKKGWLLLQNGDDASMCDEFYDNYYFNFEDDDGFLCTNKYKKEKTYYYHIKDDIFINIRNVSDVLGKKGTYFIK